MSSASKVAKVRSFGLAYCALPVCIIVPNLTYSASPLNLSLVIIVIIRVVSSVFYHRGKSLADLFHHLIKVIFDSRSERLNPFFVCIEAIS